MPCASQPFPFEVGTTAYKRCESRGLHRVIVVNGKDSGAFVAAIKEAFSGILKGRAWMPLCAKICDAKKLEGLPMLRQLPADLIADHLWDLAFLRKHCATLDKQENICDLYVTMRTGQLSWADIRNQVIFSEGLEACWDHDDRLDGSSLTDECLDMSPCIESPDDATFKCDMVDMLNSQSSNTPSTLLTPLTTPSRFKRAASELSSGFSGEEASKKRTKVRRPRPDMEVVGMTAEAV
jgi:hypothetical protein